MTTDYGFQDPTQPGMFKAEDWTNHLLLVEPHRYLEGIQTKFGVTDAIEARITVLSAQPPEVIEQARLFQSALVSALRPTLGGLPTLGRLTQQLTSGGNAAWILGAASPEDKAFAHSYLASRPTTQTPAQPQAAAVPQVDPTWRQANPALPQVPQPAPAQQYAYPSAGAATYPVPQVPVAAPVPQTPAAVPAPVPQPVPQPVPMSSAAAPAAPAGALSPEQIAALPPEVRALIVGQQGAS
jgi:hypothetical protein